MYRNHWFLLPNSSCSEILKGFIIPLGQIEFTNNLMIMSRHIYRAFWIRSCAFQVSLWFSPSITVPLFSLIKPHPQIYFSFIKRYQQLTRAPSKGKEQTVKTKTRWKCYVQMPQIHGLIQNLSLSLPVPKGYELLHPQDLHQKEVACSHVVFMSKGTTEHVI